MDIALEILGCLALIAFIGFIVIAARSVQATQVFMGKAEVVLQDIKKDVNQMTREVSLVREHAIPVLNNVADITKNVANITDGLAPRVEAIYNTVDDALNVVHGAIDDVERIKDSVVQTIESPLNMVRRTSTGVVGTIFKGVTVVRDLIGEFSKNGKS